jgi:hypothetical protein
MIITADPDIGHVKFNLKIRRFIQYPSWRKARSTSPADC